MIDHHVEIYQREYDDDFGSRLGPIYVRGDALFDIDSCIRRMASGRGKAIAYHVTLRNGQRVIVRPLSPLRRQMREDDRKARQRFIPTMNLDGTTNLETATRLALPFGVGTTNAEAAARLATACDHLGARGYGE